MSSEAALPPELLRERIRWVLLARVVIVTLFLGAWALSFRDLAQPAIAPIQALAAVIVAAYLFSLATVALYSRTNRLRWLSAMQVAADVGLITAAIPMTGGLQSPMAVWYNLAIIGAAALLLRKGALAAATLSSITYGVLMNLLYYGWLPAEILAWSSPPTNDFGVIYQIGANIASFYSIALLATVFVERMAQSEAILAETRALLETSEEDLSSARSGLDRAEADCQRALAEWRRADEAYHRAVTEGQDAQDRLHREQEVVAKSLASCVLTVGDDGLVQSVVGVATSILGREPAEIVGRAIGDVFPVLRPPLGSNRPLDPGAIPSELAYRVPSTRDGGEEIERMFRCRTVRLEDTYGSPLGSTLYVFQDVTRPRDAERRPPDDEPAPVESAPEVDLEGMIGRSKRMQAIDVLVRRVAPTGSTVLVTGESGTGKELVARALHSLSPRRSKPLVTVNCAAIPENLLESELFGHVRGAFTGAVGDRRGLLRSADGGTVFLDEIGELPHSLQAKLLRVLQERSFTPVGSTAQVFVDVRIVAATNRDLESAVAAGKFRDDLYYRLNVIRVAIPPLRERPEDLPVLIDHFLRHFAAELKKPVPTLSPAARQRLLEHPYPGNIRELENVIEHAVALAAGETIEPSDLPQVVGEGAAPVAVAPAPSSAKEEPSALAPSEIEAMQAKGSNLDLELETVERRYINQALRLAGGVRKRAAELLGINYRSLRHRLAKYGFEEQVEDELH